MKESIVNNLETIVAIFAVLISFTTAIYLDIKARQSTLLRERYEKVYYPLYKELKGILYKYDLLNQPEFREKLVQAKKLLEKEEMLAGFRLCNTFLIFYENKTYSNFIRFCNLFFNEYILFSKRLGLTSVTQRYRIKNRLYSISGMISYHGLRVFIYIEVILFAFMLGVIVVYHITR